MDEPARRHRHGRHHAPRRLHRRARARARRWPTTYGERGRVRAPPPPLRVQPPLPQPASRTPASCCSGTSPDGRLVEFIELDGHPFWVGTQAHPEFKSRPDRPAPAVPGVRRRRAGPGRGPQPAPASQLDAEPAAAAPAADRRVTRDGFRQARRAARSTRATSSRSPSATFDGPDGDAVRARRRPPPGRGVGRAAARRRHGRAGAPVPGRPRRATCSRSPPASATSPASRPRLTAAPRAGGGGRPARRPARAAGRVLQLARLQRRALVRLPGHRPRPTCRRRPAGRRGAAHDDRAGRRSPTCPAMIADRRAHRRQDDHRADRWPLRRARAR